MYFHSKPNQMQNISNLFYFGITLYMFRSVSPSIIRSLRLYIQLHTIQVLWLLVSKQPQNLYGMMLCLQSWTPEERAERPTETCRVLFQNKINLRYSASGWFYYRNILRCMVLQTQHLCILSLVSCSFHVCPVSCPLLLVSVCYNASDMGHLPINSTLINKNNYSELILLLLLYLLSQTYSSW
jgi:hypothetical protein